MRVLFLAHRLPYPPDKGDKIRSFAELQALARDHEVDLFCFYDQPRDREYFADVLRFCRTLYAEPISWLRSRAQAGFALISGRPFTPAFFRSREMAKRVQRALVQTNYDLVFVYGSAVAPYAPKLPGIPRILDMVDVDSDKWRQYALYSRPPFSWVWNAEGRRLFDYEKRVAREFSLTLVSTEAEAEILKRGGSQPAIEVFENRMDATHFDPEKVEVPSELKAYQPYLVFTGSMDYFPNVDAVTNFYKCVFPAVRDKFPAIRLIIAGRNPSAPIRKLARDSAVLVTGTVGDIRPYLRGASAAIAPLRIARGIQTKIIEAMAMGLPTVVSSRVADALPQPLRDEVKIADEPERVADILVAILRNSQNFGQNARAALLGWIERSSWECSWEGVLARATGRMEAEAVSHVA